MTTPRAASALIAAAASLALAAAALANAGPAGAPRPGTDVAASQVGTHAAPSRLLVGADEYFLTLSRRTLARGTALIQFVNRGEDPHDLRLRRFRRAGRPAAGPAGLPETPPGQLRELETRLAPGRYRLWCSIPGHRRLGMRAVLRVSRR
jgi:hypothetical protein